MIVNYREWLKTVPPELTGDPLWTIEAYRLALFAADIEWADVTKLMQDKRTLDMAGQLYRALGSIAATSRKASPETADEIGRASTSTRLVQPGRLAHGIMAPDTSLANSSPATECNS